MIKVVVQVYRRAGFQVIQALMDGKFELLQGNLAYSGKVLNTTAGDKNAGEAECYIRTIKELMRGIHSPLLHQHVPPWLVTEMGKHAMFWLNAFWQEIAVIG